MPITTNSPEVKNHDKAQHFLTYPFELAKQDAGGLPSIMLAESRRAGDREVTFFTTDTAPQDWETSKLRPADAEPPADGELFKFWFGTGPWTLLHPNAYSSVALPTHAQSAVFSDRTTAALINELGREMAEAVPSRGSLEFMLRYVEHYGPSSEVSNRFNARFSKLLAEIPDGSVMNWQDYFFEPAVNAFAEDFRARGIYQSYHLHSTIPDSLHQSAWGRSLLKAVSKVDVLYTYAQVYNERLERQLCDSGLRVPEFKVFNLGLDENYFR